MTNTKITLSSPWMAFYRQVQALFKDDPQISIKYDDKEKDKTITLYVENPEKADALSQILPEFKTFGSIKVFIKVIPANVNSAKDVNIFEKAFKGNPAFAYTYTSEKLPISYVVFKKKVVQYFNDALNDAHGVCSTLYQDIAKDVFEDYPGIYFCTDVDYDTGLMQPLGEWP